MPGPQADWFERRRVDGDRERQLSHLAAIESHGLSPEGPPLARARGRADFSEPVGIGAIQVPAAGEPILLMADRQTAGGYPKIGYVIAADLPVAGQLAPGDFIEFHVVHAPGSRGGADRARAPVAAPLTWRTCRERVVPRRCRAEAFGAERVKRDAPLAPFTTFKVGGPAECLIETQNADEIVAAVRLAHAAGVQVTMLGGGSNVLIADRGMRGLVIRRRAGDVRADRRPLVRADAAVTINGLVRWTINRGYAGLEAWAGTPGTVGGAIYGNAHWKKPTSAISSRACGWSLPDGTLLQAPADRMEFGYDYSRLKRTGEVVLWAAFRVTPGAIRAAARVGARVAGVPQAHAAARVAERRLHLS